MGRIKNEYKSFLDDIEKNVKNKEDLDYIKGRFASFVDVVADEMNNIAEYRKEEVDGLAERQNELESKMEKMQGILDNIEKDIYSEDGFDFEIVCPYCDYDFVIDIDDNKTEVVCPECENVIELDWSGNIDDEENDSPCSGSCHGCHGCESEEDDDM